MGLAWPPQDRMAGFLQVVQTQDTIWQVRGLWQPCLCPLLTPASLTGSPSVHTMGSWAVRLTSEQLSFQHRTQGLLQGARDCLAPASPQGLP